MSATDLASAIRDMREFNMSDAEILAQLRLTGYEGDSLPTLEGIIPSVSEMGTKPVLTKEAATFEERAAVAGRVTEAQKTLGPATILRGLEKRSRK